MDLITVKGGCHCGAVRWEAKTHARVVVQACNCSICEMVGFLHLIVPKSRFRLLTDENMLTAYQFNTGVAQHLFCKRCGVKSYYIPRSNPDGVSLNLRAMDRSQFEEISIEDFDGRQWEANAAALRSLSKADG